MFESDSVESYVNLHNVGQFLLIFTMVWDTLFPFNSLGRSELIFQGVLQNYGQESFFLDCCLGKHCLQPWHFCSCLYLISLPRSKQPVEFRHLSKWWLRAVTQNIYFPHVPRISCQFQPGHEWTSCQWVWRAGFPFLSPAHLYSHFLWVKFLPEVELGILRLDLWGKKKVLIGKEELPVEQTS